MYSDLRHIYTNGKIKENLHKKKAIKPTHAYKTKNLINTNVFV